jgi:8-oxo-dGTP pyrophosphatase MutT (NUDIX family)
VTRLEAGTAAPLKDGATVMLVRDGAHPERPLEVLMLLRHPSTAFGQIWCFPGGVVETDEDFLGAAVRETHEETSLEIDPAGVHYFSHWITPEGAPKRYDTRFFVTLAPAEHEHAHARDEREHTDSCWIRPDDALERHHAGAFDLIHPTIRSLEALGRFATADELLAAAQAATEEVHDDGGWRIVLPGDADDHRERRR